MYENTKYYDDIFMFLLYMLGCVLWVFYCGWQDGDIVVFCEGGFGDGCVFLLVSYLLNFDIFSSSNYEKFFRFIRLNPSAITIIG